ncbi:MAG: SHOCT domain-containing protein [Acidimicrobiia bacterium]|nr:SHOCT domain-containing protein [Acidimicrobiia bacterium]
MPLLDVFWAMLGFFIFIMWFWLLIVLFTDIFRDRDTSGWIKALWVLFLIILPLLGALIYLIVNGDNMAKRNIQAARDQEAATQAYIRETAGSASTADELAKLKKLHDDGVLTDDEFASQKAKVLG